MKEKRVVTSNAPVTTICVQGTKHHFFHSEELGKCRAIQIAEDANLSPAAKQDPTPDDDEQLHDWGELRPYKDPEKFDDFDVDSTEDEEPDYLPLGKHYDHEFEQCAFCGKWIHRSWICDDCWED